MLKRFASIAGLTVLLGVMFAPAAHAQTRFSLRIGPSYGAYGPGPGYVWQPGYYAWTGYGRRWVPGTWVHGRRDWSRERWGRDYRGSYWRGDRNWDRGRDRGWNRDRGGNRDRDRRDWNSDGRDRRR